MKIEFSRQIFKKFPNIKFYDNPSSGRRGIPCGRRDGQTDRRDEVNLLKPNDIYVCRTAALPSRRYILNIYSTNIHTEYFKHAA